VGTATRSSGPAATATEPLRQSAPPLGGALARSMAIRSRRALVMRPHDRRTAGAKEGRASLFAGFAAGFWAFDTGAGPIGAIGACAVIGGARPSASFSLSSDWPVAPPPACSSPWSSPRRPRSPAITCFRLGAVRDVLPRLASRFRRCGRNRHWVYRCVAPNRSYNMVFGTRSACRSRAVCATAPLTTGFDSKPAIRISGSAVPYIYGRVRRLGLSYSRISAKPPIRSPTRPWRAYGGSSIGISAPANHVTRGRLLQPKTTIWVGQITAFFSL
jgi:hypothetical protein